MCYTPLVSKATIHARLDAETQALLRRLRRRTGLSDSEILREGIRVVARDRLLAGRHRIVGLGRFASGRHDLGSNKTLLEGFGRS